MIQQYVGNWIYVKQSVQRALKRLKRLIKDRLTASIRVNRDTILMYNNDPHLNLESEISLEQPGRGVQIF